MIDFLMELLTEVILPIFGVVIAALAAFVLVVFLYVTTFSRWACEDFARISKLETQFTISLGCYIKAPNGEWMSEEAYNKRNVQNRHQLEFK